MLLPFVNLVTIGVFSFFLLLFFRFYNNYWKTCAGFPFSHIMPYLIYCQVTGKISKDIPLNHVLFQKLTEAGKKHAKEGLFMTYFSRPVLFIFGEDAIKVFANEKAVVDKSPEYLLIKDRMGHGLITSNGERWKSHRKLLNPAFHMGVLKEKITLFNEHAMSLVKDMENMADEPSVDILGALKCHSFNALSESILGLKQSEENKAQIFKFGELVDKISVMVTQRIFFPWLRWGCVLNLFPFGRKHLQEIKQSDNFVTDIISEMKKHVSSNRTIDTESFGAHLRKSFIYILINQHLKDPSFTLKDVHDEVKTTAIAGYDAVTYATMWCLYLLGSHLDVQEKVYSEIQSITSDYVTYEECSKLVYLESVIMECLRLYPVIPIFSRNLSKNVKCGKYEVFKDTTVAFFPYLAHRDPNRYPDPENFYPERFLNAETKTWANLIPFSEGRRSCIGKNYGLISMKIFLAHIVRNFQVISLDKREDIRLCWTVVLSPVKHLRMKINLRHNVSY